MLREKGRCDRCDDIEVLHPTYLDGGHLGNLCKRCSNEWQHIIVEEQDKIIKLFKEWLKSE